MMEFLRKILLIVSGYYLFRFFLYAMRCCWRFISPALYWTGLIWPALIGMAAFCGIKVNLAFWIIAWVICSYVLAQNLIRHYTHNPAFSFVGHLTQNKSEMIDT